MSDDEKRPQNDTPGGYSIAFWQIVMTTVQTVMVSVILGVAGYIINGKIEDNTAQIKKQSEAQDQHNEDVKTGLSNVESAAKAIPKAVTAKVVVEAHKAGDEGAVEVKVGPSDEK